MGILRIPSSPPAMEFEKTPLLLDNHHHGVHSQGSGMRSLHDSHSYPLRRQLELSTSSTSSPNRCLDQNTNPIPSSYQPSPSTFPTASRIWQEVVSLPHRILCFSSPSCSPCCGLCCCVTCIRAAEYGVMQRFGKFDRFLHPGMHVLKWPMEREAGRISTRIQQLDVDCETKSRDHVFIRIHVSIQYQTNSTHLYESYYSLSSPIRQFTSNVHDIVRSTMPRLDLDDIFSAQDTIAQNFHDWLNDSMNQYGYLVHHVLITRIRPNEHVQQSMNEIVVSKRMKESMSHKAEAIKIEIVMNAEAKAERDYLIGVGVAKARREIVRGMLDTVSERNNGVSTKCAMDLLLLTQYYSVLEDLRGCKDKKNATGDECVGDTTSSTSLLLNHMPDTVSNLTETVRECFGSTTTKTANLIEL